MGGGVVHGIAVTMLGCVVTCGLACSSSESQRSFTEEQQLLVDAMKQTSSNSGVAITQVSSSLVACPYPASNQPESHVETSAVLDLKGSASSEVVKRLVQYWQSEGSALLGQPTRVTEHPQGGLGTQVLVSATDSSTSGGPTYSVEFAEFVAPTRSFEFRGVGECHPHDRTGPGATPLPPL